jgi:hypothetical protein
MTPPFSYISVIISPLKRTWPYIWSNLNPLHPRIICNKFDWFWPAGSGEEDFQKFSVYSFSLLSPLGNGLSPSFEQIWILFTLGQFVLSLVKIGLVVLEKIFKWPYPIFTFLWLSPLWRGPDPLFEKKKQLEFPSPKDNLYQVWFSLACWFWRRFLKFFSAFSLFRYYLPLERSYPLSLNKLKSPSPIDNLCQVWLKLALWF